jgi:hypothetical protein
MEADGAAAIDSVPCCTCSSLLLPEPYHIIPYFCFSQPRLMSVIVAAGGWLNDKAGGTKDDDPSKPDDELMTEINPLTLFMKILPVTFNHKKDCGLVVQRQVLCSGCALALLWLRSGCALAVLWLCSGCALALLWLRSGCALVVPWPCSGCALAVLWLCSGCALSCSCPS